jgi:hypothetical protein
MNFTFREEVIKASFRPAAEVEDFEVHLRGKLGLKNKYESARLSIGRSLAQPTTPVPVATSEERGKPIPGELLFGNEVDLWIAAVIMDGELNLKASLEDFRILLEAHWARGGRLLKEELEAVGDDETRLLSRLAELLPDEGQGKSLTVEGALGRPGEICLRVGSISKSHPEGQEVTYVLNGPGTAPHIALMGKVGSGKTTTGVQIARQIVEQGDIPFLFIDPKGEFVDGGHLVGALSDFADLLTPIEVGQQGIPLDFLPEAGVGATSITQAAMQFRDSIVLCCKSVGNIQQDSLRSAVEDVIRHSNNRGLTAILSQYEFALAENNKPADSVVSRLRELTALRVFVPTMPAAEFFSRSWVLSLKGLSSEELKRLAILLVLDALKGYILSLSDSPVEAGFRTLRHLLIIDEARRILAQERYQSLVDLVRQGRSKGEVVMLLSQDPSDFEGKADDFMTQLGTVISFACAQSERGLKALQGPFGRKLQSREFSDTHLPTGVAFVKLPNRQAERIQCWAPLNS